MANLPRAETAGRSRAFRLLTEMVYQPTEARRDELLRLDWSDYPRVARALERVPRPVTPSALSDLAHEIVTEAASDLRQSFPDQDGTITPLEVVRLHILERRPWPSIEAQLQEAGRPYSRGTLIRRQHEFLPYLMDWAARAGNGSASAVHRRSTRRRGSAVAATSLLILILGWVGFSSSPGRRAGADSGARPVVPAHLVGRAIPNFDPRLPVPPPHVPISLPDLEISHSDPATAMILECETGRPELFVGYRSDASPAVQFCLWDPVGHTMLWETSFLPPNEERLTHDGVGVEVFDEPYRVANLFHAGPEGDLGKYVVAVCHQNYSPTFVLFLDIHAGTVAGYYVHPGQIGTGLVLDIGQDGRREVVLAGQDNALNRPVVVQLRPGAWKGAASTVSWNESGEEAALERILLPAHHQAVRKMGSERLEVVVEREAQFDLHSRVISFGASTFGRTVYHVRLGPGLRPTPSRSLIYWDSDLATHREFGLDMPPIQGWQDEIVILEGVDPAQGTNPRL